VGIFVSFFTVLPVFGVDYEYVYNQNIGGDGTGSISGGWGSASLSPEPWTGGTDFIPPYTTPLTINRVSINAYLSQEATAECFVGYVNDSSDYVWDSAIYLFLSNTTSSVITGTGALFLDSDFAFFVLRCFVAGEETILYINGLSDSEPPYDRAFFQAETIVGGGSASSTTSTGSDMVVAMVSSTWSLIGNTWPLVQWILGFFVGLLVVTGVIYWWYKSLRSFR